jgi:stalled ribosome rescue protein Dom34
MTYAHAVVWIDHREAKVVDFTSDAAHRTEVRSEHASRRVHHRAGTVGSGHAKDDHHFFDQVVEAIGSAREVLVVGPGEAKQAFVRDLSARHPEVAKRVVGVESADHPTDGELLAMARRSFTRIDGLLGA